MIQAFPLDAGTDNGFTFTSPNWETEPRAEVNLIDIQQFPAHPTAFQQCNFQVFQISNSFPAHPAGSFNYPSLPRLPILAQYSVIKVEVMAMMMTAMVTMDLM